MCICLSAALFYRADEAPARYDDQRDYQYGCTYKERSGISDYGRQTSAQQTSQQSAALAQRIQLSKGCYLIKAPARQQMYQTAQRQHCHKG